MPIQVIPDAEGLLIDSELAALRSSVGLDAHPHSYWKCTVFGGRWTRRKKKVVADFVLAHTTIAYAKQWAKAKRYPRSKRYSRKLYGHHGASMLAQEFARRSNFFAAQFFEGSVVGLPFHHTEASNEQYVEQIAYLDWALALPAADPAFHKVHELRTYLPRVG